MDNYSDEQLVVFYLAGDQKALEILVRHYLNYIYNFIIRYTADAKETEDLTQEVFLRVWKNLKKFNQQKSFKVWLFSIARNICVDYLRKKKIPVFSSLEKEEDDESFSEKIADPSPSRLARLQQQELGKELNSALLGLPEKYRATLLFYYNGRLTFQEIADLMKEPIDTIKSRHRRGLILLRKKLT